MTAFHVFSFFPMRLPITLSGKVNRHNVRLWGTAHPHATNDHERDSPN
jgi:hypothetical protein